MAKYAEYAVFWRFSNDHDPSHWTQIGKPTKDLEVLREIFLPEGTPTGIAWTEADKSYKIMQRTVTTSEWRNEESGSNSFRRYGTHD